MAHNNEDGTKFYPFSGGNAFDTFDSELTLALELEFILKYSTLEWVPSSQRQVSEAAASSASSAQLWESPCAISCRC